MSSFIVALSFLIFLTADFIISYISPNFIPYLGFFPYREIAEQFILPKIITGFANFDGAHYLLIARDGYQTYQQAFFPLYPLLIRWLSPIFSNNLLITALLISNLSFLFGLYYFAKYLHFTLNTKHFINWTIILLLTFPTSFFFGGAYTEGLFFLLLAGTLYFLKKEKYLLVVVCALLAGLTKLVGVFLIIPIIFHTLQKRGSKNILRSLTTNYLLQITLLSPIIGLGIYSTYLWKTTGDPLFFINSQWAFGAHRSSALILLPQVFYRYLKIFFTAQFNFQYFISLFEFVVFNFVLIVLILDLIKNLKLKIKNYNLIGLNLFSLINLILPTLTGTLSSIPRYALFSLSFFIYLARVKNDLLKVTVAIVFAILHIVILGFFIQGYFVA